MDCFVASLLAMTMKHFVARMSEATSGRNVTPTPDFASLIRATGLRSLVRDDGED